MNKGGYNARAWDLCTCGRHKDRSELVCKVCYRAGHPGEYGDPHPCERFPHREPAIVVLACPDDEVNSGARFRAGAQFSLAEFGLTTSDTSRVLSGLKLGVWPPNMVVLCRGAVLQVVGAYGTRQSVRRLAASLSELP
jgi:hypothetical protein